MGHIDHQIGTDTVSNLAEPSKINVAAIGRAPGNDQLGLFAQGRGGQGVIIDQVRDRIDRIGNGPEPLARLVGRRTMSQVTTGGQIHAQKRIAGLQQGQKHSLIGLGARMGLNIGIGAIEQGLGPLNRQGLGNIDKFAAAIIPAARIALGILVGQDRALGLEHGARDNVFRRDQLDLGLLTLHLLGDTGEQFGVRILERSAKKGVQGGGWLWGLHSHGGPFEKNLGLKALRAFAALFTCLCIKFNAQTPNLIANPRRQPRAVQALRRRGHPGAGHCSATTACRARQPDHPASGPYGTGLG